MLITGGAGGVGSFAIQIAKHVLKAGCVVTTASAGEKEALCRSLGADEVVDYHSQKFEEVYVMRIATFRGLITLYCCCYIPYCTTPSY